MSALALVIALVGGKLALSALTVADYVTLTQAGISVARLLVVLDQKLHQSARFNPSSNNVTYPHLSSAYAYRGQPFYYQEALVEQDGSAPHGRRHKLASR